MRNGIQARRHFLEGLLFTERGENRKQRPIKGVEGWLALQKQTQEQMETQEELI